jgi:hypothetical protein
MKHRIGALILAILTMGVATNYLFSQNTSLTMQSAMSPQEYDASGIGTLRLDQQGVINRWLNRWTSAAFGVSCGGTYPNTGEKQSIDTNADGKILILDDGSIWLVESTDRIDSSLWLGADDVMVTETKGGFAGYRYNIINLDEKEKVLAKYLGQE